MNTLVLDGGFGVENLRWVERPVPRPARGQVLLHMRAASLNYRDLLMVRGEYNPRQPLPLVPCSDGVGVVEEVGPDVEGWRPGDRVMPCFIQGWQGGRPLPTLTRRTLGGPLDGVLTEWMVVDGESIVAVPQGWSNVEAATLPCAAVTAWRALVELGGLRPGESVLIQGTGGVASFAVQIAKGAGAYVVALTSSASKRAHLKALGADVVIDRTEIPAWGRAVRELVGGQGVDHVLDVGGAATVAESIRAARLGGHIALVGNLGGNRAEVDLVRLFMKGLRLSGVFVGSRQTFLDLVAWLGRSSCRPVIDATFSLREAPSAFARLASRDHIGKICLTWEDGA